MDNVDDINCVNSSQELRSEGHGYLSGLQLQKPLLDTKGKGGHQAEEGGLQSLFGWWGLLICIV